MYRPVARSATVLRVRPLPAGFLHALDGQQELLVTSREGDVHGTVPVWFIVRPPGVVYLFTQGFSVKARRWRSDPWVRLSLVDRSAHASVEGEAHFVSPDELDDDLANDVVEHWAMQGAPTAQGLRRTLRDGVHALVRVESPPPLAGSH
jgi:hypothetical protein